MFLEFLAGMVTGAVLLYAVAMIRYRQMQKRRRNQMPVFMLDENGIHALGDLNDLPFPPPPPTSTPPKKKPHLTVVK